MNLATHPNWAANERGELPYPQVGVAYSKEGVALRRMGVACTRTGCALITCQLAPQRWGRGPQPRAPIGSPRHPMRVEQAAGGSCADVGGNAGLIAPPRGSEDLVQFGDAPSAARPPNPPSAPPDPRIPPLLNHCPLLLPQPIPAPPIAYGSQYPPILPPITPPVPPITPPVHPSAPHCL